MTSTPGRARSSSVRNGGTVHIFRYPPAAPPTIVDDCTDLLQALTTEQRRILIQRLADDYYSDGYRVAAQCPPSRALVQAVIAELGMSTTRGHPHRHAGGSR